MTEGVLILEPGDERAKKIGRAMANESATAILSVLKDGFLTLSEISERMDQPMTTVKYHVENLLDAELIEVKKIRYSEKGREVKIYGVNDRLVIVAPSGGNVKDTLLKYASVFAILLLATLAMVAVSPTFNFFPPQQGGEVQDSLLMIYSSETATTGADHARNAFPDNQTASTFAEGTGAVTKGQVENISYAAGVSGEEIEIDTAVAPESTLNGSLPGEADVDGMVHLFIIAFFLGGCLILAIMMLYEVTVWRKEKKFWNEIKDQEQKNL
jgi:DNA-binding transcriptional ArsR family regulator